MAYGWIDPGLGLEPVSPAFGTYNQAYLSIHTLAERAGPARWQVINKTFNSGRHPRLWRNPKRERRAALS